MTESFKAACVQMRTSRDIAENVRDASDLIRQAKAAGAEFIATPEMTALLELDRPSLEAKTTVQEDDEALKAFQALADELGVWLMIGSLALKTDGDLFANRSFLLSPEGAIVATYDKIHMFDVVVSETEKYRESATYKPGSKAVVADLPWCRLGFSVCYDVRFPHLYRQLAQAGAKLITVPAAFTEVTGQAHWHVLQRARAIETGCFVMAPAQGGVHDNGRHTFGHSLIISPWGEILAEGGKDPCLVIAEIDLAEVDKARAKVPAWQHNRPFEVEVAAKDEVSPAKIRA